MIEHEYIEWGKQLIGYGFSDNTEAWRVLPSMERYPDVRDQEMRVSVFRWFYSLSEIILKFYDDRSCYQIIDQWFKRNAQCSQVMEKV